MHEYTSRNPGLDSHSRDGLHHYRREGSERGIAGAEVRQRGAQGLHRTDGVESQERKPRLFLHLTAVSLFAGILSGCTSAGNATLEERNAELVCPRGQIKVCPSAVGTASRIKKDQGACFCRPRD
jgi:hypothetical protein